MTVRPGWWLPWALSAGCAADLLPDERVLGDEVPARTVDGGARSELGASVAVSERGVLAGAPGTGEVVFVPDGDDARTVAVFGQGGGERVWWRDDQALAWQRGVGTWQVDFERGGEPVLVDSLPGVTGVDLCPDGRPATVEGPGEAVACGDEGVLRTRCVGSMCTVERDGVEVGTTTSGSAVAWVDGLACWGDISMSVSGAGGRASCEEGTGAEGLPGDHVGVAIAEGRAAGVFNKWQVPARGRVVSLHGGEAWSVDRAAERSRLALAHGADTWVVGVPGFMGTEARQGRLYIVADGDVEP